MDSAGVRHGLMKALRLDLVGPGPEDEELAGEVLPTSPSKWYLTGFLVPRDASLEARSDELGNDELEQVFQSRAGDDDEAPEKIPVRRAFFPSSMGLSLLVPEGGEDLEAVLLWGDYEAVAKGGG